MMTDGRKLDGENPPKSAQTPPDVKSSADSIGSINPCVHNEVVRVDSLVDSSEYAEEFLRRLIDTAQVEAVESQVLRGAQHTNRTADAAVIGFVTTYAAAHASPRNFLRRLTNALRDLEAVPPTEEQINAR